MNQTILQAKDIYKTFKDPDPLHVLKGACLEVNAGESVAIIGKSGEGKSTLLHILGTLESPCSGQLLICGEEVNAFRAASLRNRHIGFIFQAFHLLEEYTLIENILMPARIGRNVTANAQERAHNLLKEVDLEGRKETLAKNLSGGEKQRVAIARALLNDPALILADEPTGNLDRANSARVHELLFKACKNGNKGLIIVTHDLELAALCDRTLTLKDGVLWSC